MIEIYDVKKVKLKYWYVCVKWGFKNLLMILGWAPT